MRRTASISAASIRSSGRGSVRNVCRWDSHRMSVTASCPDRNARRSSNESDSPSRSGGVGVEPPRRPYRSRTASPTNNVGVYSSWTVRATPSSVSAQRTTSPEERKSTVSTIGTGGSFEFGDALFELIDSAFLFDCDAHQQGRESVLVVQHPCRVSVVACVHEQLVEPGLIAAAQRPSIRPPTLLNRSQRITVRRIGSSHQMTRETASSLTTGESYLWARWASTSCQ
ncbi:hypothetical protein SAMN04488067_104260 [Halorubrum xinjiangense]|uniref:Uncharacterized protein n=1 Tax=Halorubrum xinjiangense TaxID=261291 RepID=A0A1G7L970_9EURY|nr:hypothetical protein SAMN04488067_104260 [Halorubrum xinjiangense]